MDLHIEKLKYGDKVSQLFKIYTFQNFKAFWMKDKIYCK